MKDKCFSNFKCFNFSTEKQMQLEVESETSHKNTALELPENIRSHLLLPFLPSKEMLMYLNKLLTLIAYCFPSTLFRYRTCHTSKQNSDIDSFMQIM